MTVLEHYDPELAEAFAGNLTPSGDTVAEAKSADDSKAQATIDAIARSEDRIARQLSIFIGRQRREVLSSGYFDRPQWDRQLCIIVVDELRSIFSQVGAKTNSTPARLALLRLLVVATELNAVTEATLALVGKPTEDLPPLGSTQVVGLEQALSVLRPRWAERNAVDADWLRGLVGLEADSDSIAMNLVQWAAEAKAIGGLETKSDEPPTPEEAFDHAERVVGPRVALSLASAARHEAEMVRHQEAGVATSKIWFSARDSRVRNTHRSPGGAHGQVRALGEPFQVGASLMQFPHDPAGELRERVHCRCVCLFVHGYSIPLTDEEMLSRAEVEARSHPEKDAGVT